MANETDLQRLMSALKSGGVKPTPKPKPTPKVSQVDQLRRAVNPDYKPGGAKTLTQKRQASPGTLENDMLHVDRVAGAAFKHRALVRDVMLQARASEMYSESELEKIRVNAIKQANAGKTDNLRGFVADAKRHADWLQKEFSRKSQQKLDLEARQEQAAHPSNIVTSVLGELKQSPLARGLGALSPALSPENIARSYYQPNAVNDNTGTQLLRLLAQASNEPVSNVRAVATGDTRPATEMPEGYSQLEQALNFALPYLAGGATKGLSTASNLALNAALDLPGMAMMGVDAGPNFGQQLVEGANFTNPQATSQENFAGFLNALGLGALGIGAAHAPRSIKELATTIGKAKERPASKFVPRESTNYDPGVTPNLVEMAGRNAYDPGTDLRSVFGSGATETPAAKPKTKIEPKVGPNYQAGDVSDIRKGLKSAQKPAATQKEPWQMTRREFGTANPESLSVMNGTRQGLMEPLLRSHLKSLEEGTRRLAHGNDSTGKPLTDAAKVAIEKAIEKDKAWLSVNDHKGIVQKALSEGKPVPAEVLADYPDLVPKPKPKPADGAQPAKAGTEAASNRTAPEKSPDPVIREGVSDSTKDAIYANTREVFYQWDKRTPEEKKIATQERLLKLKDAEQRARDEATIDEAIEAGNTPYKKRDQIQISLTKEPIAFPDEVKSASKLGKGDRISVSLVNGETWWTNAHFAYKGELPKGHTQTAGWEPNIARVIPVKEGVGLTRNGSALSFPTNGKTFKHAVFMDDAGRVYTVDAGYVAGAEKYFGNNIEFRGDGPKLPITIYKNGELVGVLMPTGISEGLRVPIASAHAKSSAASNAKGRLNDPQPKPQRPPQGTGTAKLAAEQIPVEAAKPAEASKPSTQKSTQNTQNGTQIEPKMRTGSASYYENLSDSDLVRTFNSDKTDSKISLEIVKRSKEAGVKSPTLWVSKINGKIDKANIEGRITPGEWGDRVMRGESHIANVPEDIRKQVERDVNDRRGVEVPQEQRDLSADVERFSKLTKPEREAIEAAITIRTNKSGTAMSMSYSNDKKLAQLKSDLGVESWGDVYDRYEALPEIMPIKSNVTPKHDKSLGSVGTGEVSGETWWTDRHQAYKGGTPKGVKSTRETPYNITRVIPDKADTSPAKPIGISKQGHTVLESAKGRVMLDSGYVAMARKQFGDGIEFRANSRKPSVAPVLIMRGDETVGVIMPIGLPDEVKNFKLATPRTSADALADAKSALQDFKDAPKPKGVGKGKQTGSAMVPITPQQAEALTRAVKHFVEAGHLKAAEVIAQVKQALGDAWHDGLVPHIEKIFNETRSGRADQETVEAPTNKDAAKVAKESKTSKPRSEPPATGLARQFEDPERQAAGKERIPGSGVDPKNLAEAGEKAYRKNPSKVIAKLGEIHKSGRLASESEVAEITAYKRDLVNEQTRIADKATNPDSSEHVRYGIIEDELDRISEVAQVVRGKFHSLGMALQTAFNADFSVAELTRKARALMGGELPEALKAKFKELEIKYSHAMQELDKFRAQAEAKARGWSGKASGVKLQRSAASKLTKLGLVYAGDLDVSRVGGGFKSKQAGAIQFSFSPEMGNEIANFARGIVYEDGFTTLDDLVSKIQKSFPELTEDHILGSLSGEYRKARLQADIRMMEARKVMNEVRRVASYRKKSKFQKLAANISETFNATNRAFQTSTDMSAPFIQGAISLLSHPDKWVKSWGPMLKAVVTGGEQADLHYQTIVNDPRWAKAKAAGLDLSMPGGSFSAQEEMFAGALVKRMAESNIPGMKQIGKVIEHSEAAFTVYMNNLRWEIYTKLAALDPGDAKYLEDVSRMVNIATGKGHGSLARQLGASDVPGHVLYAPKYTLSQFQFAAEPLAIASGAYKTKLGRKQAILQYTKVAAGIALTGMLVEALGGEVEKDPRSTDFGRWRLPNGVTVNVFGRISDPVKILSQLFWGRISQGGKYTEAGDYGAVDFWSVAKSKASPLLRTVDMVRTGTKFEEGKMVPAKVEDLFIENFTPIGTREMVKTGIDKNASSAEKAMSLLQILGIDSQRTKLRKGKVPPMGLPPGLRRVTTGK